jgi:NAD(P)-dependent dehydrogenase (short-subunit alcohol dehydrogenase family)
MNNLEKRVAVITGATGGLGKVVARVFAEQGAWLVLLSRDQDKLDALARDLDLPSERIMTYAVDLTDPDAVRASAEAVSAKFGRVEALIHLVGGWTGGKTLAESGVDEFESMLDQHAWTTVHLLRAFSPRLAANGWGRVIVVSSASATNPPAKRAAYGMAKAAQEALMLSLANEFKGTDLTANVIQVDSIDVEGAGNPGQSVRGKGTSPEEIAAAMVYLCSDEARKLNGARIPLYD